MGGVRAAIVIYYYIICTNYVIEIVTRLCPQLMAKVKESYFNMQPNPILLSSSEERVGSLEAICV